MKLYIKQKVFSWKDRFYVKNEFGEDRFYIEGELFSWGKKLHVFDHAGRECAFIREKVWSFLPKFHVLINDREIAEIVKEFSFFHPKYRIDGLNWQIEGDFWDHDYDITCEGRKIVGIHRKWMTWADCYELDIQNDEDVICALAVVLAIDCVRAAASAAAST